MNKPNTVHCVSLTKYKHQIFTVVAIYPNFVFVRKFLKNSGETKNANKMYLYRNFLKSNCPDSSFLLVFRHNAVLQTVEVKYT